MDPTKTVRMIWIYMPAFGNAVSPKVSGIVNHGDCPKAHMAV